MSARQNNPPIPPGTVAAVFNRHAQIRRNAVESAGMKLSGVMGLADAIRRHVALPIAEQPKSLLVSDHARVKRFHH